MTSWIYECRWKSAPISLKQPPENTHPHDPHGLLGGSGILGTLALTETSMPSLPACFVVLANARPITMLMIIESDIFRDEQERDRVKPGVDGDGLLDDQTILDELADVLARVGVGNLVDLVGVQPHLWRQSQISEVEILKSSAPCSCRTS